MAANGKTGRETAVGLIFFLALGLLGVFTILIGDIPVFHRTWTFDVLFDDVGGLEPGQEVLYAGGRIGNVKEVITEEVKIRVRLEIAEGIKIYRDGEITIEDKSALGGMRVMITRGTPKSGLVLKGSTQDGQGLSTLTSKIKETAQRISKLADSATETLSSVKEGKGTIGKLWTQDDVYNDLKTAISDLKQTAANFKSISGKVDQGEGILGDLVNNNESRENLRSILKSWKTLSEKLEKGEGALGDLITNPETKKEVKTAIVKVREFGESVTKLKTHIGVSFTSVPDDHYTISKVYLRLEPSENAYYLLGGSFFKIQDSSRLTTARTMLDDDAIAKVDVQIARRFMDRRMTFRAGLLEGKPGAGLDYTTTWLESPFTATLEGRGSWDDSQIHEAYDPFLLRAKVDWTVYKYFHVIVGVNSILESPSPMYGIGFEFQDQDLKYLIGSLGAGT